jgi:hypothetical protein
MFLLRFQLLKELLRGRFTLAQRCHISIIGLAPQKCLKLINQPNVGAGTMMPPSP